jgi:phosphohistidine phosphatase
VKTLYLLRHAKSDWSDPDRPDFERPLNRRGRRVAPLMGRELRRRGWHPERVLCSAARRTRETWTLLAAELGDAPKLGFRRGLYLATPAQLMRTLRRMPPALESVLVLGHNPGLQSFALGLSNADSRAKALERLERKFPTAALAVLRCPIEAWEALEWDSARLTHCLLPRELL